MITIELLNKTLYEARNIIQAVANIEITVQPQDAWSYQAFNDLLKQDSIQLLTIKNEVEEVIGYCLYQIMFEQAEILRIGTHLEYQRQGIASQLFEELHKQLQAQQVTSLLLEVRADNTSAIKLYEQQNFTVIHQRCNYYKQPNQLAVDALIMQHTY